MNLRDAAQQILDYAPHVETAWQGDGVCAVPIRYIIDLKRAMEDEKRVKTVPYSTLHTAMFGE